MELSGYEEGNSTFEFPNQDLTRWLDNDPGCKYTHLPWVQLVNDQDPKERLGFQDVNGWILIVIIGMNGVTMAKIPCTRENMIIPNDNLNFDRDHLREYATATMELHLRSDMLDDQGRHLFQPGFHPDQMDLLLRPHIVMVIPDTIEFEDGHSTSVVEAAEELKQPQFLDVDDEDFSIMEYQTGSQSLWVSVTPCEAQVQEMRRQRRIFEKLRQRNITEYLENMPVKFYCDTPVFVVLGGQSYVRTNGLRPGALDELVERQEARAERRERKAESRQAGYGWSSEED